MILCCLAIPLLAFALSWTFPSGMIGDGVIQKATLKDYPGVLWAKGTDRMLIHPAIDSQPSGNQPSTEQPPRFLRVHYPRNQVGSSNSGASFLVKLPPKNEYRCSYRVRFPAKFDFVKGGKLPGLAGGETTAGGERPRGDGWSARFMWRSRGDLVLYLYHMDQIKQHGDDIGLSFRAPTNEWLKITQVVTVNDDGKSNGRIRVWIDEVSVLDRQGLRLRKGNMAAVDRFYFSTFYGGSGADWAPRTDQHIDFADFTVW